MSCAKPELNERLVELLSGDVPELAQHAKDCEQCSRELVEMREAFGALEAWRVALPSEAALARAQAVAQPNVTPVYVLWGGLALAALCVAIFHVQPGMLQQLTGLTAVALSAAAWILGVRAAAAGRVGDPAFWTVALAGATLAVVSQPTGGGGSAVCLALALAAAAGPLVLATVGLKRGGLVLGAAAGLLGLSAIRMHCPAGGIPHALMHHLPVVAIFVALGALASRARAPT